MYRSDLATWPWILRLSFGQCIAVLCFGAAIWWALPLATVATIPTTSKTERLAAVRPPVTISPPVSYTCDPPCPDGQKCVAQNDCRIKTIVTESRLDESR